MHTLLHFSCTLGILDIFKQYEFQVGIFVHDALYNMLPAHFDNYFSYISHNHETRQKLNKDLHTPKYRSGFGQSSIKFAGAKIWNSLPHDIRSISSKSLFKKKFKQFLLDESCVL